ARLQRRDPARRLAERPVPHGVLLADGRVAHDLRPAGRRRALLRRLDHDVAARRLGARQRGHRLFLDSGLVAESFAWGLLAASSLVIGAVFALAFRIRTNVIGLIMAFGAGVLISAVAFDLVDEAAGMTSDHTGVIVGLLAGCGVFFGGDWLIDRAGG